MLGCLISPHEMGHLAAGPRWNRPVRCSKWSGSPRSLRWKLQCWWQAQQIWWILKGMNVQYPLFIGWSGGMVLTSMTSILCLSIYIYIHICTYIITYVYIYIHIHIVVFCAKIRQEDTHTRYYSICQHNQWDMTLSNILCIHIMYHHVSSLGVVNV